MNILVNYIIHTAFNICHHKLLSWSSRPAATFGTLVGQLCALLWKSGTFCCAVFKSAEDSDLLSALHDDVRSFLVFFVCHGWDIELRESVVVMPSCSCQLQRQSHVGRCRLFLFSWIILHHLMSPALFCPLNVMKSSWNSLLSVQHLSTSKIYWLIYFWKKQMA